MKTPVRIVGTNIAAPMFSRERGGVSWNSGLEQLVPVLQRIGYAGLRVFPTHALVADIPQQPELARKWVASVHQNFHTGKGLLGRLFGLRQPTDAGSIAGIQTIQNTLQVPARGVFYLGHRLTAKSTGATVRAVQPKIAEYKRVGAHNAEEFHRAIRRPEHGLNAVTLDAAHSRSGTQDKRDETGNKLPSWDEDWPVHLQAGVVSEVDLGFFRTDMNRWDPGIAATTDAEGRVFSSGKWQKALKTEVGDMIGLVMDEWRPHSDAPDNVLQLVVETPPSLVGATQSLIDREKPIVETLGQLVEHLGGVVLQPQN